MNLLSYKNRFKPSAFAPQNIDAINGYLYCLADLLKYMEDLTEFNPHKRMIDSVDILNAITETNAALQKIGEAAKTDLQAAFNEMAGNDDLKDVL
jgi:hypothetical protein